MGSSVSSRRLAKRASSRRRRQIGGRQQVAAVCYRIGSLGPEFLLVQTRGGRWIFPKGGVEPGLTQAQSAALEAFEEAGVHGRIEEMPFARYHLDKSSGKADKDFPGSARGTAVTAHLCEATHLEPPQEANRNPTWFSPQKAKRRLREDRTAELGDELEGVVDRAVSRIQRLRASNRHEFREDELQKVRFEAFESLRHDAALLRHFLLEHGGIRPAASVEVEGPACLLKARVGQVNRGEARPSKVLQLRPFEPYRLGAGALNDRRGKNTPVH